MNVTQHMQRINTTKHLGNVETRMSVMQNTSVVQQCAEITSGDILHRQIDLGIILEGIEQLDKPFALRSCENIALGENMTDLIELEKQLLAHNLQRAYLTRILLLRQIHLSITTLTDLSQNLEITLAKTGTTLAEMGAFATEVF